MESVFPHKQAKKNYSQPPQKQDEMCFSHTITAIFIPHLSSSTQILPLSQTFSVSPWYHCATRRSHFLLGTTQSCHQSPSSWPGHKHRYKSTGETTLPFPLLTLAGDIQITEHPQCCLVLNHTPNTEPKDSQGLFRGSYERGHI